MEKNKKTHEMRIDFLEKNFWKLNVKLNALLMLFTILTGLGIASFFLR